MLFAVWAEQYIAGAVHLRPTTRRAKRYSLDNHVLPAFGSLPLGASPAARPEDGGHGGDATVRWDVLVES